MRNFAAVMAVLDAFQIDLTTSNVVGTTREWDVDDAFFAAVDGLVRRGNVHVTAECVSATSVWKFMIQCDGIVTVPCDRCLADLELRIESEDELKVKLGAEYSDDGDCVVVPETEGCVNLAQYIYEFIALSMPITCQHEPGGCDDAMMQTLSEHQAARSSREDDEDGYGSTANENEDADGAPVDSRWAALAQLKNQNK